MNTEPKSNLSTTRRYPPGLRTVMDLFDVGPRVGITGLLITVGAVIAAIIYVIHSAPPSTIAITSGPPDSIYYQFAQKYAEILKRNGVTLKIVSSEGSQQNLERLAKSANDDSDERVDIGFVQAGAAGVPIQKLVSLGSIQYQPIVLFYRGKLNLLSDLQGKKVAVGALHSGTRKFALALLAANGISELNGAELLNLNAREASKALLQNRVDAAFIMGESASVKDFLSLVESPDIKLYNFKQANGYARRFENLNALELPEGTLDFARNIPAENVSLVGPMVDLVAVSNLHPALSDLLLEAATEVHSRAAIFQRQGEFPTPVQHSIRISNDALRFYKSGKSFWYRYLPFWIASLTSRIVLVIIPLIVILVPVLKSVPDFFRWLTQVKISHHYRELLQLEHDWLRSSREATSDFRLEPFWQRFDQIEKSANQMQIPAGFASQFYDLREHIDYVRNLMGRRQSKTSTENRKTG